MEQVTTVAPPAATEEVEPSIAPVPAAAVAGEEHPSAPAVKSEQTDAAAPEEPVLQQVLAQTQIKLDHDAAVPSEEDQLITAIQKSTKRKAAPAKTTAEDAAVPEWARIETF